MEKQAYLQQYKIKRGKLKSDVAEVVSILQEETTEGRKFSWGESFFQKEVAPVIDCAKPDPAPYNCGKFEVGFLDYNRKFLRVRVESPADIFDKGKIFPEHYTKIPMPTVLWRGITPQLSIEHRLPVTDFFGINSFEASLMAVGERFRSYHPESSVVVSKIKNGIYAVLFPLTEYSDGCDLKVVYADNPLNSN